MIVYPARISIHSKGSYELELVDEMGTHQVVLCTSIEDEIGGLDLDPDPFILSLVHPASLVHPRLLLVAVMAFHRACVKYEGSPTSQHARSFGEGVRIVYPERIGVRSRRRYELELVDEQGMHQVVLCTPQKGEVEYRGIAPERLRTSRVEISLLDTAVLAFHRACIGYRQPRQPKLPDYWPPPTQ